MWIGRKNGVIYGAWSTRQPDDADHPGQEEVADDHPDLVAFQAPKPPVIDLRAIAIDALLAKAALDPDAPQEVKDYVK